MLSPRGVTIDAYPRLFTWCYMGKKTTIREVHAVDQLVEKAIVAYDAKRYGRALLLFTKAARLGDECAANYLGVMYSDGRGIERDPQEAIYWYRKAVRKGDTAAISNLGVEYRLLGNHLKALTWFRRAARRGDGDAWLEIAKIYAKNSRLRWRCLNALESAIASSSITRAGREEAQCLMRALRNVGTNRR